MFPDLNPHFFSTDTPQQRLRWVLFLACSYFVSGWLGLSMPYIGAHITLVWLPTGISVAALLLLGARLWPGVYLGALAVNLSIGSPPLLAAGIAIGNTLAPVLASHWLRQAGFHPTFDRQRDIFLFLLAAAGGMAVSASSGVLCLYLADLLSWDGLPAAWLIWWLGDSVGVLLGGPLLLTLTRKNIERLRLDKLEFLVWLVAAASIAWISFIHDYSGQGHSLPLAFLTLPLLAWPALRFGITGASLAFLGFSIVAAWGTANGRGSFHSADMHLGLFMLWAYMVTAVLTGLLITALLAESVQTHNALQRERDDKQRYLDIAGSIILVIGADGRVRQINPAGCRLLGRSEAEIIGQDWFSSYLPSRTRGEVRDIFALLMSGIIDPVRNTEGVVLNSRGEERLVAWHNAVLRDESGAIIGSLSSGEDITERKHYEESLVRGREEFQAIFDAVTESIFLLDTDGLILAINPVAAARLKREPAELIGKIAFDLLPAELAAQRRKIVDQVIRTGRHQYAEDERDGITFAATYYPVFGTEGKVEGLALFAADITARKQAERQTLALLHRSRLLMDTATDGIHILDSQGKLLEANNAFITMLGYSKAEAAKLSVSDWEVQWQGDELRAVLERVMQTPDVTRFETRHRCKNGTVIDVEVHSRTVVLDGESVLYASSRNITERKKADKLLAESEKRYRQTVDAINEGMWAWDLVSGEMVCDARWYEILGFPANAFAMSREALLWRVHPDDEHQVALSLERLKENRETQVFEFRFRDHQDAWRWLQGRAKVVEWDADGSPRRVVGTHTDISQRKLAEMELQQSKDRLHLLLTSMQDRVLVFDTVGRVTESFASSSFFGPYLPPGLVAGRLYGDVLPGDVSQYFDGAIAGILADGKPRTFEFALTMDYGEERVSLATLSPLLGESAYPQGFIAVIRDITDMHRSQQEVARLAQKNALLLESLGEGVYGVDREGNTTFANDAALAMLGLRVEEVSGHRSHELFHHRYPDETAYPVEQCPIFKTLRDGQVRHTEAEWYWHKDGHGFPVSMTVTPVLEHGQSVGAVVVFQDISARKKAEAEIYNLAFFDPLTKLPNRRLLLDRINQAYIASERHRGGGALLFIDLDNFKTLNDTEGHDAGDELLRQVAQRLLACVRGEDTVARLGGDEFVVLLSDLAADGELALSQACGVAEKIRVSLDAPYDLSCGQHHSTPSIGIAGFSGRTISTGELLKRADGAMYQAKAAGRNAVRVWRAE